MSRAAALLVAASLLPAAGCGTSHRAAAQRPVAHPFPQDPQIWARATTGPQRRSLAVLAADVARIRAASLRTPTRTLMGTPALRRTTGRFLVDLDSSPVGDLSKNRIIDHAAAAAAGSCDQCFQQLEATRPIPAIAEGDGH